MKKIIALLMVFFITTTYMPMMVENSEGEDVSSNQVEKATSNSTKTVSIDSTATNQNSSESGSVLADATTQEMQVLNSKDLFAKAAVLLDGDSGRILYGKNEDEVLAMASTTKIMTLIVALEQGNLDDVVTISKYAASMPDVQLNAMEKEQFYLKDLMYSLMLESHNDSAVAIAEHIGGSVQGFADLMNAKAKELGCDNTFFITPNGLDASVTLDENSNSASKFHSTTARDLATIMRYCINISPKKDEFRAITGTDSYSFHNLVKNDNGSYSAGSRTFSCNNHNAFLHLMEGAFSGKTGFTGKAGYCYVGALERDGKCFIVALLACGWPNNKSYKWSDTKKLMNYGLENWNVNALIDVPLDQEKLENIVVCNGVSGFYHKDVKVPITYETVSNQDKLLLNKDEKIEVQYEIPSEVNAPIQKGQEIGSINYMVGDTVIKQCKVYTTASMDELNYKSCVEHIADKFMLH